MAIGVPGNIVVANQGLNPLVSYNYMLRVEGVFDLPCKAIHKFTKENEYEYIQEGGLNDYVHMRRKPVTKPFTFTVERYVGIDYYDPLKNGTDLILPVILLVTRHANRFDVTKRAYVFTGCTVVSKEYGELDAEHSGLLTETTVIGYREMLVVNASDKDIGTWGFDKDNVEGNGSRFARTYEELPPEAFSEEELAKFEPSLWEFVERKPEGNGKRRAVGDVSTLAAKPRLWELDGNKVDGKGTRSARRYTPPEAQGAETGTEEGMAELGHRWEFDKKALKGNGVRSAKTESATKAEGRKWPSISSARKYTTDNPGGE